MFGNDGDVICKAGGVCCRVSLNVYPKFLSEIEVLQIVKLVNNVNFGLE